tara:strand:+ start:120 stop:623 length:504 start_codon:yes stop_codon:yes gene_type:complete
MNIILKFIFLVLILSSNAFSEESNDWEVFDIPHEKWWVSAKPLSFKPYRNLAVATCNKKKKFTFQFVGSNRTKDTVSEGKHVVRYFCSRNKLTIDPISGDTFPIKSLLGKAGSMPNPLNWSNYNEEQKNSWTTPTTNIKKQCLEFGFKEGTEKFADCQLKIYTLQNQ